MFTKVKKSPSAWCAELILAIAFALFVATIIRQTWFELYQIPTGSMRPTYREMDHLIVSKTTFGLNIPFLGDHLLFNRDAVQRGGVVIWSGDKIDLPDTDTKYFWLFPVKKRYIKRLIGKPGDQLYFYGGQVWGLDADGNDLPELRELTNKDHREYIPFTTFDGQRMHVGKKSAQKAPDEVFFKHFNIDIGRLMLSSPGKERGEVLSEGKWIADQPYEAIADPNQIHTFTDLFGIGNFAMARVLTKDEVEKITKLKPDQQAPLYLEMRHHPSMEVPRPHLVEDGGGRTHLLLTPQVSLLPLSAEKIKTLMGAIYTARFVVEREFAYRYSAGGDHLYGDSPTLPGIPDGTYEFYDGIAYAVKWGGHLEALPKDHPLYDLSPAHVQKLFNLGIEFSLFYSPSNAYQIAFPSRYAYFRDGDLYVMGAPLFTKEEATLQQFVAKEQEKEKASTKKSPYLGFFDRGAPVDKEKIKTFGLKVPEGHYLVLGDNHAMSGDGRYFGFVPEANIEGTPMVILWPPGSRWGFAAHKVYPWLTLPNLCVGSIVAVISIFYFLHKRKQRQV